MSIWLIRAGKHGEHEHKFLQENRIYLTWDRLQQDLASLKDRAALFSILTTLYPAAKTATLHNWVAQIWAFAHTIQPGDLVAVPLKSQPAVAIAEVTSNVFTDANGENPYHHWRTLKNLTLVPRQLFPQDILYSLGSVLTICRIQRNNAETRIRAMRDAGWKKESLAEAISGGAPTETDATEEGEEIDLEVAGRDQIAQAIERRFKGHDLTRLVEAILRAQGYTTYRSPEGADGGADILAGLGPLGFGAPQLCVEVKSQTTPVDRPTVDKLLGAVDKFRAQQGLFVAWGGFKPNVYRELASLFFKLRLWTRDDLLAQLFSTYDKLDEDLRAELPLKRVWTVALGEGN